MTIRILLFLLPLFPFSVLTAQPLKVGNDPEVVVRNLTEINSEEDDYAPFVTPRGDLLYFTSSRRGAADLYRSERGVDTLGPAQPAADLGINSPYDDGILNVPLPREALFGASATDLISSLNRPARGVMATARRDRSNTELQTFTMSADGRTLEDARPLDAVNLASWDSQPAISSDSSFIIFTSIRDGGVGGKDLFISYLQEDGEYAAALPLGKPINTRRDEISPFIGPDGRSLFFASNGHDGYGGFDLYMSTRDPLTGEWQDPRNLGPIVNSKADEIFFFGASRDFCYFVSDREGGVGGLDIYECSYNPFTPGFGRLIVEIVDTTTGKPLDGFATVSVRDLDLDLPRIDISSGEGYTWLPSDYGYDVAVRALGFDTVVPRRVDGIPMGMEKRLYVPFGSVPPAVAPAFPPAAPTTPPGPPPQIAIDFEGINVPLFVSGYYRLNTLLLLEDLRRRQVPGGDLEGLTYIENVTGADSYEKYRQMSLGVEKIIGDFYRRAVNEYFPTFNQVRDEGDVLELNVYGYADPRPIIGRYEEKMPISFYTPEGTRRTVHPSEELDNLKLSGLRAFFAVEYLDRLFREAAEEGQDDYVKLVEDGAIRWRPISGNVDEITRGNDLAEKRRIRVTVEIKDR